MNAPESNPWDGRERRGQPRLRHVIDRLEEQIAVLHMHIAAHAEQIEFLHARLDRLKEKEPVDREETIDV